MKTCRPAAGAAAEAAKEPVSKAEAHSAAKSAPPPEPPQHRAPGIRFPPRRTPEGERITMLPAEEQLR